MVERRRANQPKRERQFRYSGTRQHGSPGRRALLRALATEYELGNSLSKLYASLLARAVVAQEPRLLRKLCHTRRTDSDRGVPWRVDEGSENHTVDLIRMLDGQENSS
jgi:hypothetical protein